MQFTIKHLAEDDLTLVAPEWAKSHRSPVLVRHFAQCPDSMCARSPADVREALSAGGTIALNIATAVAKWEWDYQRSVLELAT
jgi:hypothetical protein